MVSSQHTMPHHLVYKMQLEAKWMQKKLCMQPINAVATPYSMMHLTYPSSQLRRINLTKLHYMAKHIQSCHHMFCATPARASFFNFLCISRNCKYQFLDLFGDSFYSGFEFKNATFARNKRFQWIFVL